MLRMLAGEAARRHGRRDAFVGGGRRITFADLDRLSDSVAAGLAHRGVLPGDVVAIALPPIPEYAVCALAVAKLSAVIAGYDPSLPSEALARLHEVIQPCLTIAASELWLSGELVTVESAGGRGGAAGRRRGAGQRGGGPGDEPGAGTVQALGRLARAEPPPPPLPPDPYRPIMIITAGPADDPRGAIFGGRQLDAIRQAEAGTTWGGGEPRLLGEGHSEFLTRLPSVLQGGTTVYALPSPEDEPAGETGRPDRAAGAPAARATQAARAGDDIVAARLRATAELGLSMLAGTPALLATVLDHPLPAELDFAALQEIVLVGPPPDPALVQALRDRFAVPVRTEYRPVEAGLGVATSKDAPPEDAETTVGRPVRGVTVAIRDPAGRAVGGGGTGEVLLRSGAVMSGYWNDSAATARTITKDGFVRTGDVGWVDEAGRLHLQPMRHPGVAR
jgi:long-chain acyl-CoA synthetase